MALPKVSGKAQEEENSIIDQPTLGKVLPTSTASSSSSSLSSPTSSVRQPQPLCFICTQHGAIYTCPACEKRTCSLACSKAHKVQQGCTGVRDKVKYVPMNKYGWGMLMNDYVFLEDTGRKVEELGQEIVRNGYDLRAGNGTSVGGSGRGQRSSHHGPRGRYGGGIRGSGRGRGAGGAGGPMSKRDVLKMQLELRDIDMDLLPLGMSRRAQNQSGWDAKERDALLTIEFRLHPPRDPAAPSFSKLPNVCTLLTHRNKCQKPLLALLQHQVQSKMTSKKENGIPAWVHTFINPEVDDPTSFVPPLFCMSASRLSGKLSTSSPSSSSTSKAAAYYKLNPAVPFLIALKNLHFVEFPTIDVFEESQFSGSIVDPEGRIMEEINGDEERPAKRPRLTARAMQKAIGGHIGDYGTDSEEEQEGRNEDRMATLGDYGDSDEGEEENAEEERSPEQDVQFSDEDDEEVDPQTLVQLLQQVQGQAMLDHDGLRDDDDGQEVDWGDDDDAEGGE